MRKVKGRSKVAPEVPIEGYNPDNSGIVGTGESMADMFLELLKEEDPKLLKEFQKGGSKITVINS